VTTQCIGWSPVSIVITHIWLHARVAAPIVHPSGLAPPGLQLLRALQILTRRCATLGAMWKPWLSPSYSGVVGTTAAKPSEPSVAVTYEWPITWLSTPEKIPKAARETLFVRRFSADQALAIGVHAFSNVRPGPHPNHAPDTIVTTNQGDLGVESTCLTLADRRGAHSLFRRLRQRVLEQDPAAFAKLSGYMIYVWFEQPGGPPGLSLPLKRTDDEAATELLRELAAYTPQPGQMWLQSGALPEQAPPLPLARTPSGGRFYAIPLVGSAPSTVLFTFAGFELGLAFTSLRSAQSAWDEIQRLVDQHDKVGVDILLITSGGPDQNGQIFPAEEAIAGFLLETPIGLTRPPRHIKRVFLHSWTTGFAAELHPSVQTMFGPLYQSFVPEHYPLVISATGDQAEHGPPSQGPW
jgi:hypothetical protein